MISDIGKRLYMPTVRVEQTKKIGQTRVPEPKPKVNIITEVYKPKKRESPEPIPMKEKLTINEMNGKLKFFEHTPIGLSSNVSDLLKKFLQNKLKPVEEGTITNEEAVEREQIQSKEPSEDEINYVIKNLSRRFGFHHHITREDIITAIKIFGDVEIVRQVLAGNKDFLDKIKWNFSVEKREFAEEIIQIYDELRSRLTE